MGKRKGWARRWAARLSVDDVWRRREMSEPLRNRNRFYIWQMKMMALEVRNGR